MTARDLALAANLIVAHTALNLALIINEATNPWWIFVQTVMTLLTLGVILRSYAKGGIS